MNLAYPVKRDIPYKLAETRATNKIESFNGTTYGILKINNDWVLYTLEHSKSMAYKGMFM